MAKYPYVVSAKVTQIQFHYHESPKGSGFVDSSPSNAQYENGANGRSQIRSDGLNVIEELRSLSRLDDGNPQNRNYQQNHHENTTNQHQFDLSEERRDNLHVDWYSHV